MRAGFCRRVLTGFGLPKPWLATSSAWRPDTKPCGSELARDSGRSANISAEWKAVFASEPAPTFLIFDVSDIGAQHAGRQRLAALDTRRHRIDQATQFIPLALEPILIVIGGGVAFAAVAQNRHDRPRLQIGRAHV